MSNPDFPSQAVFVCSGSKCGKHKEVRKYLKERIKEEFGKGTVEIFKMECSDRCKHAPILSVQPANTWYAETSPLEVEKIITQLKGTK